MKLPTLVSEKFGDLSDDWVEMKPSSSVAIHGGGVEIRDLGPLC
jgi:hypothetical protein